MNKFKEDDCVIRFVTELNDNFAILQSQVLLVEPLPSLNKAFSMAVQFERENGLASDGRGQIMINAAEKKISSLWGREREEMETKCVATVEKLGTQMILATASMDSHQDLNSKMVILRLMQLQVLMMQIQSLKVEQVLKDSTATLTKDKALMSLSKNNMIKNSEDAHVTRVVNNACSESKVVIDSHEGTNFSSCASIRRNKDV